MAHTIHLDGTITEAELTAFRTALSEALDCTAKADDAMAAGMSVMKGGPDAPHAVTLMREYREVHSAPVQLPVHINRKRPDHGSGPSAA